jgi:hypothetical protein
MLVSYGEELSDYAGGQPLPGYPRLLIQHIRGYIPYLKDVCFECGNEPSGSIKGEEFFDQLSSLLL